MQEQTPGGSDSVHKVCCTGREILRSTQYTSFRYSAVRLDNPVVRGYDGRGIKQYLIIPPNLEFSTKGFQARGACEIPLL